jgi:hypothetical protein
MSSNSHEYPSVDGALALKEIPVAPPSKMALNGPQLVLLFSDSGQTQPDTPEKSSARQFFIDLRQSREAEKPPVASVQPTDWYETCCGQCGHVMLFRTPLTDWTRVFCGPCTESVWVR